MQSTGSCDRNFEYYTDRLRKLGDSSETFWNSRLSQNVRFRALTRIGDLDTRSILDVGCGTGDFLGFLTKEEYQIARYLGCDLVGEAIQIARTNYPGRSFIVSDVRGLNFDDQFDFVFGSGLFALDEENWHARVIEVVAKMYALCRIGIGVNFLSELGLGRDLDSFYSDPGEMFTLLTKEISPQWASLDHTYKENDFTIFLYSPNFTGHP